MREFILHGSWRKLAGLLVTQVCIMATAIALGASPDVAVGGLVASLASFVGAQMGADRAKHAAGAAGVSSDA